MDSSILLLFVLAAANAVPLVTATNRPIIGVLAQKTSSSTEGDTYIPASYVKYLDQAGARVVPILAKQPDSYYAKIFSYINGALFPGGSVGLVDTWYAKSAEFMYNMALKANDQGDYFPLWGTCQGFQMLMNLTAGQNLLQDTDSFNYSIPLHLTDAARSSRLLHYMPGSIVWAISHKNITSNMHHYGMYTKVFNKTSKLTDFYSVLSTNLDRKGVEFVSTVEAIKYPVYGTQWHPEKNNFLWDPKYDVDHGIEAIKVSQYMANFFVQEARRSQHKFPDVMTESKAMIENYKRVYSKDGSFELNYFFNFTTSNL